MNRAFLWLRRRMRKASILTWLFSSLFLYVPAIMISSATVNHPLWILAFYVSAFCIIRVITHDFDSAKSSVFATKFVLSILQGVAGLLIVSSVIAGGYNPLWLGLALIFLYHSRESLGEVTHIIRVKEQEKKRAKRAKDRRDAFERVEQAEREEARRKNK